MSGDFSEWYERVYPRLSGYGLWLRGGELNTLLPEQYGRRSFHVLFARLSTYQDTAESFTHTKLYAIARSVTGVFPDLAYLPPRHDLSFFGHDQVPWLLGTQTHRGPRDFDLIGFSNSIVQELINLPSMLKHSGIPLRKSERLKDPAIPLILLGGANALHSSVFWTDDPPVDGIFVGEAEEPIARILAICRDGKKKHETKVRILKKLESVPGFFQPEGRKKTSRHVAFPEAREKQDVSYPVPFVPSRAGEGHLPISEGCPCFCTFCAESYGRKPYREYPAESVVRRALAMKAAMGLNSVDLYSFNFNMHSEFYRILWELAPLFSSIGLKSQRLDFIAHDPGILGFIHAVGKSSLTCGIEGVSERLRRYLNKNLPDEVMGPGLKAVLNAPIRELKIFLIATGLETDEDFAGLKDLLEFIHSTLQHTDRQPRIIFSVTPLVRFPWTPLEFADAFPVEHMKPIMDRMKGIIRARGFEFRQAAELDDYWFSQVLVRAADPRVGEALLRAIEETGFVYLQTMSADFLKVFRRFLEESGLGEKELLRGASAEESARKPWAGIGTGIRREFLFERYALAAAFKETDYCLGRGKNPGKCRLCGACPDPDYVRRLTQAEPSRVFTLEAFQKRIVEARRDEAPVDFLVRISERGRGLDRHFVGAALARAVMQADPDTTAGYRRYGGSFWDREGKGGWLVGDDRLTLFWNRAGATRIHERMKSPAYRRKINREMDGWGTVEEPVEEANGIWTLAIRSPFAFDGRRYFEPRGIKFTLLRQDTPWLLSRRSVCAKADAAGRIQPSLQRSYGGQDGHGYGGFRSDTPPRTRTVGTGSFTLRRLEEATYRLDFSKDSLKKKIIDNAELVQHDDGCELTVVPGVKFDVHEFLSEAFVLQAPEDWVRIEATASFRPSAR